MRVIQNRVDSVNVAFKVLHNGAYGRTEEERVTTDFQKGTINFVNCMPKNPDVQNIVTRIVRITVLYSGNGVTETR